MRHFLILFYFIFSFQSLIYARKRNFLYYQSHVDELIDIFREKSSPTHLKSNADDSNDHVDIDRWNQLNDEDIQEMPEITDYSDENNAIQWLNWFFRISERFKQVGTVLSWNYETNITEANQRAKTTQNLKRSPFVRMTLPIAKKFNEHMKYSSDNKLKRIFARLASGSVSHNNNDVKKTSALLGQMTSIYSTSQVCEQNDNQTCYSLTPYLDQLMQTEKDYDRLVWAWKGWHDECGNRVRPIYLEYIDLLTKNSKENGNHDLAEEWISDYEMGNTTEFQSIVDQLLKDIMPLYQQLHAYVRGRLCAKYPKRFDCNGPIPAHILGNMWAQTWQERFDDVTPFSDAPLVNITQLLHDKNFTIHQMYTTGERFFTSIGLYPMTPKFWTRSLFEKPKDRQVVCQAAASDFDYHDDYRVRICTELNDDNFYTVHHEMGHIEYYMSYAKKQPFAFRDGANSGFHEAIGDTIAIYAISPTHLVKLGFLDHAAVTPHYEINYLMRIALQKIAFLPFGYALDKYRFALFRNQTDREHELNSMWWALRIEHGGIMAAVQRSDATNFDPGAKYHVPANVPYFRYFIAHFLQFQFYRSLCRLKGYTSKLHMCDIYGRKDVGARLKDMLAMGNSKSWSEILKSLTGEDKLESGAMLEFFKPLYKWLKAENLAKGYPVGWM